MYSEVLKLLGLRNGGRHNQYPLTRGRKLYGSMSSLPSVSSIGSRHVRKKVNEAGNSSKSSNKRFQRLESHVVTLARSVAHLSSEMRSQHALAQEVEALRAEVQQLKTNNAKHVDPDKFFESTRHEMAQGAPRLNRLQANRVRKLTQFFGDEPPLLRLFLKNLGYEKYAAAFEEAKIGLLELPCLSDERLERLGIPMGPRLRIMQEAKVAIASNEYNVYIL